MELALAMGIAAVTFGLIAVAFALLALARKRNDWQRRGMRCPTCGGDLYGDEEKRVCVACGTYEVIAVASLAPPPPSDQTQGPDV